LVTVAAVDGATAPAGAWHVKVYETVAPDGQGVPELVAAIQAHYDHLQASGEWLVREKDRSRQDIAQLLQAHFMEQLALAVPAADREALIAAVARREVDPYTAVARLFAQVNNVNSATVPV
jgi:LAO/AO transport system kinase